MSGMAENLAEDLRDANGEVVLQLANGCTLRSGGIEYISGEYIRLCEPDGTEYAYWDQAEWRDDPALVMGAIINTAAGLRLISQQEGTPRDGGAH